MVTIIEKLKLFSPVFPRKRYNIFTGTNSIKEWRMVLGELFSNHSFDSVDTILEYEKQFSEACDAKHAISFGAGRMALYAILESLDIGEGDEVIIPAFTCVVVPNAILYRGAKPVYVDIESKTFNIDIDKIEEAITPKTKALYAQHTFGISCGVDSIKEIANRHNLPIIEDAAHSLGAKYKGKKAGSLTEVAFFTTDHSKIINTHLGGMAVTNDPIIANRLREIQLKSPFLDKKLTASILRTFLCEYLLFSEKCLWIGQLFHSVLLKIGVLFYFGDEMKVDRPSEYPYPCRLSSVQAKLGISQLKTLSKNLAHRRSIATYLESQVGWNNFSSSDIEKHSWLRYSFLVKNRDTLTKELSRHFDLGIWFTSVVSGRDNNFDEVRYIVGSCPVAEFCAQHIINLPTHQRIPLDVIKKEIKRISILINEEMYCKELE